MKSQFKRPGWGRYLLLALVLLLLPGTALAAVGADVDQLTGQINANNRIPFRITDSSGHTVAIGTNRTVDELKAIIVEQSNPEAKISAQFTEKSRRTLLKEGTGELLLTSDQPTEVTIQVYIIVNDDINTYYTGNITYTFLDGSPFQQILLSVGSSGAVVNGEVIMMDSPAVVREGRLFIPYRVVAEAFGAEVAYDEHSKAVEAVLGEQTVRFVIGEKTVSNGGELLALDAAPYIDAQNHTMIPARAVGALFGFEITPEYATDGSTVTVLFTRAAGSAS